MRSHTIPRKLLEQFSFYDEKTKSLRLWRYGKGQVPRWDASPRTATRIPGHFAAPDDARKEAELEKRLNQEFEEPVNRYLDQIGQPGFHANPEIIQQLTLYLTLLFHRSEARRKATRHTHDVTQIAFKQFIENDVQTRTLAAYWNMREAEQGVRRERLLTKDDVIDVVTHTLSTLSVEEQIQRGYVWLMEDAMAAPDEVILHGEWSFITTDADHPFIISDAPVTTWQRNAQGLISMGQGTHQPNVEMLLPISPHVCLHVLPRVKRTLSTRVPHVSEINAAQAAFAGRYCFGNMRSDWVNEIVQSNLGSAELGVKSFTISDRDYSDAIYKLFMMKRPVRRISNEALGFMRFSAVVGNR